jgi:diaminohydroxyphosphoribosylaminopyrimidine deaminase/5-amino-6-(5-phosphoribosylamino)uracil reductase
MFHVNNLSLFDLRQHILHITLYGRLFNLEPRKTMKIEDPNENYMRLALDLAKKAFGKTSPNPMVGAVIVRNGEIVGKGFHECAGLPHAEVMAIDDAGPNAKNAVLYVTLEPCSTTGRTPPCVEAIIAAKIAKVVVGSLDPNPKHAGKGVDILEKAGIDVEIGLLRKECERLNEAFFHWITTGRPFVLLKLASTLDGRIATSSGISQWITGPEARAKVQQMRCWADAIMVGGETARNDKPSLSVRGIRTWRQPKRIIASKIMNAQTVAKLLPPGPPPIVISADSAKKWIHEFTKLGENGVTALLVEGGGVLAASLLSAGVVDKIAYFIAPKILGGANSRPAVSGKDPTSLDEAHLLKNIEMEKVGNDFLITGTLV